MLTRPYEFTTVAGQDEYPLPADFEAIVDGTFWDRSTYREARGTLSPQEWQQARSSLIATLTIAPLYRLQRSSTGARRAIFFEPVPTRADQLVLEYTSISWLQSGSNSDTFMRRIASDGDIPVFDDFILELDLTWRFKEAQGLAYASDLAEFELQRDQMFAEDAGPRTITLGRSRRTTRRWLNAPEVGFGGRVG